MPIIISFVLLSILPLVKCLDEETVELAFMGFQHKFGKNYESKEEEVKRNAIFQANLHHIEHVNAKNLSYKLGVNEHADLTHEEFAALKLGTLEMSTRRDDKFVVEADTTQLPTSVDWRNKSVLSPVKNQGSCGSCWAFSAAGALEAQYAIATGKLRPLSVQELVDCSSSYGNKGCLGGLMTNAYKYIKSAGLDQESTYPYKGWNKHCFRSSEKKADGIPAGEVTGSHMLAQTEQSLMKALAAAPVSLAMYARDRNFRFYRSGVYSSTTCNGEIDHGVVAVGYGADKGSDYFILKNSWGSSWGIGGYFYLKRGVGGFGECKILENMCVATLKSR
ncbi:cathepsin L, putative [Perkinsus marinus ATCC 50983]|uniref:Cathepsin L, putative n=1 Tax=Perkinsus marinus (strain ATCC 50983 / TXsc) TaxID=423536 RepID=C5LKP1_PERM5|nr:cathepsin L, putative [Perkinsus marinus ATCC 50983]EER02722.1 cathepsin L, putative [Perkinsus marinus ATCC 50983]|eukprot:XP_002770717.1 cathepsin L, putative [Perkinsus marinus ATCC 50983]